MTNGQGLSMKKAFNYALVGSLALGAVLGIVAVLSRSWGWVEVRVMLQEL
jgi:hypothetical protein